ncbi:MAG TPA: hypothetical protein VH328_12935, partial [Burkholderiaceae bacterium]|nr:hypothetical protein [Burkholderiaceae bacterium]
GTAAIMPRSGRDRPARNPLSPPRRARTRDPALHAKITRMDTERINAIGHTLADLSERTQALRGYL